MRTWSRHSALIMPIVKSLIQNLLEYLYVWCIVRVQYAASELYLLVKEENSTLALGFRIEFAF